MDLKETYGEVGVESLFERYNHNDVKNITKEIQ
jgi:hypothetical protein